MLPRILGNSCQASLANLARTLGHVLPEIHFVREEKHRAFAQATWSAGPQEKVLPPHRGAPGPRASSVLSAIATGKTSGCMYPYAEQLVAYQAHDPETRIGGLVLKVKGDSQGAGDPETAQTRRRLRRGQPHRKGRPMEGHLQHLRERARCSHEPLDRQSQSAQGERHFWIIVLRTNLGDEFLRKNLPGYAVQRKMLQRLGGLALLSSFFLSSITRPGCQYAGAQT
jgi:hypothetical protein